MMHSNRLPLLRLKLYNCIKGLQCQFKDIGLQSQFLIVVEKSIIYAKITLPPKNVVSKQVSKI